MKSFRLLSLTAILAIALSSCESNQYSRAYSPAYSTGSNDLLVYKEFESSNARGGQQKAYPKEVDQRKVIYNANVNLTSKNPDSTVVMLQNVANKYEGYALNIGTKKSVIRVKSNYLKKALEEIYANGKITRKNVTGDDISERYNDLEIKLNNALSARKKYLSLLDKAANVQEALLVEKELERLNKEIDLLKGKINRYDHLTAFSTITVYIQEKKKPGILGYVGMGLYHSVKWLFVRN